MSQLTLEQRYEIAALRSAGKTLEQIASTLGFHKSSIGRELRRNSDARNGDYRPKLAERKCRARHRDKHKRVSFTPEIVKSVDSLIGLDYSPEQIVGYCRKNGIDRVSVETIYLHVWRDKKAKGDLFRHLRRRGRRYKKRGATNMARGHIPGRIGIDSRPPIVDGKTRFGDLEADTIVGKDHKGAIVTVNDRASGMLKMRRTPTREAREIRLAIDQMLEEWLPFIKTITSDNGKEFADHREIAENNRIDFYFANPYSPWERGANENLNGLIRQYFPKKTDFSMISDTDISIVEDRLNNRPRKRFNFDTPLETMEKLLFNTEVAFIT